MQTTRLIIVAVGGQGNLLASKVLGEAALLPEQPGEGGLALQGGLTLLREDVVNVVLSGGGGDVPFGNVADALWMLEERGRNQRDVSKTGAADVGDTAPRRALD